MRGHPGERDPLTSSSGLAGRILDVLRTRKTRVRRS
jgi:hypothetical protein